MTDNPPCPFCDAEADSIARRTERGLILHDAFPVSAGHLLVAPRRHVSSFFELEPQEQAELMNLLVAAWRMVEDGWNPDGVNLGLNDGLAAGQTIPHCHWHVIPRYAGDVDDPRGGVRWVIPDKAAHWSG